MNESAQLKERLRGAGHDALRERLFRPREERPRDNTLFRARYTCALILGFDPEGAFRLAVAEEVGLVEALRLVERDCPHDLALEILL